MSQVLNLKIKGLYLNPNALSEVPTGALSRADNLVVDKESIAESRRGFRKYGDELDVSGSIISQLFNYRDVLLALYGDKLAYDSDGQGTFVEYAGNYQPPEDGYRMRSVESNRNFYFNTVSGIKKLDSITGNIVNSGGIKALDGLGNVIGTSGFMANNTGVAYRIVWGYKDANKNLILGTPSSRVVVANTSGGSRDASLSFTIPQGVTQNYFYQLYRSTASATATDQPDDELQLVVEGNPTLADIAAKEVTIIDNTPDSLRGAFLYTNANSGEGILQANEPPPFAKDMTVFRGMTFFANVRSKQRVGLKLLGVQVYTATTPDPAFGYMTTTGNTTNGSLTIAGLPSTTNIKVGMGVVGAGIQAGTIVASVVNSTSITLSLASTATASGVSLEIRDVIKIAGVSYFAGSVEDPLLNTFEVYNTGSPAGDIDSTSLSLEYVINKSPSNTSVYMYYVSAFNDLPGQFNIEERDVGGSTFVVNATHGEAFTPPLSYTGSDVSSDNDERLNRVYFSKPQQPEAVPIVNYLDFGSADDPIRRILALRDSIFVFKGDGIFRLTGESASAFNISVLDNTATIKAPESARVFNNQVFTFSDQGIIAVSDSGVQIISRAIENTLLELSSPQYTAFESMTFGVSYESERKYILYTVTDELDTTPTQAFVYNSITNTWTRWIMNRTAGIVNSRDNKLYLASGDNDFIYQERKDYSLSDYADDEFPVTIIEHSETEITLSSTTVVTVGMSLRQGSREAIVLQILPDNIIVVDKVLTWAPGDADVFTPIRCRLEWVPETAQNPGVVKHFREVTLFFRDASFRTIDVNFATNFSTSFETVKVSPVALGPWGLFPWGTVPWGGGLGGTQPIRTFFPLEKQRGMWANLGVTNEQAFTSFSLSGISIVFTVMSERFR